MVGVVQLVRAPDCGSGGRGFEPHLPPRRETKTVSLFLFHTLSIPSILRFQEVAKIAKQGYQANGIERIIRNGYKKNCIHKILRISFQFPVFNFQLKKILSVSKMFVLLHPLSRKKAQVEKKDWSGSSVWLEYMPVTHGVASSSLVRTAKQKEVLLAENFFFNHG